MQHTGSIGVVCAIVELGYGASGVLKLLIPGSQDGGVHVVTSNKNKHNSIQKHLHWEQLLLPYGICTEVVGDSLALLLFLPLLSSSPSSSPPSFSPASCLFLHAFTLCTHWLREVAVHALISQIKSSRCVILQNPRELHTGESRAHAHFVH